MKASTSNEKAFFFNLDFDLLIFGHSEEMTMSPVASSLLFFLENECVVNCSEEMTMSPVASPLLFFLEIEFVVNPSEEMTLSPIASAFFFEKELASPWRRPLWGTPREGAPGRFGGALGAPPEK